MPLIVRWSLVAASALGVLAVPVPQGITPESWHLFAIFIATIIGSIVRPVPAGAVVFLGVAALAITKTMPTREALAGYADPLVWLVLCAFFMSRGVLHTGLGRRIAYLFIRAIGKSSLGLSYALTSTDTLLAGFLPSNSARCGGVIFPIARSLAEAYDSKPGTTARRLGAFLLVTIYQSDVIACAMFLTGQASNVIVAKLAMQSANIDLNYSTWLLGSSVPGILSLAFIPWLIFKLYPPTVTHTPDATRLATKELERIGPMKRNERMMLCVFALVAGLWMTGPLHQIEYAVVALLGVCLLFLTGVLSWDDIISERGAWDVFLWYGGVVRMAEAVGKSGLTEKIRPVISRHDLWARLGRSARDPAAHLLLCALRIREHHGPRDGHVRSLRRGAHRRWHATISRRRDAGVFLEPVCIADALRHDHRAHLLRCQLHHTA